MLEPDYKLNDLHVDKLFQVLQLGSRLGSEQPLNPMEAEYTASVPTFT